MDVSNARSKDLAITFCTSFQEQIPPIIPLHLSSSVFICVHLCPSVVFRPPKNPSAVSRPQGAQSTFNRSTRRVSIPFVIPNQPSPFPPAVGGCVKVSQPAGSSCSSNR